MAEYNLEEWLRAWQLDDLYPKLAGHGFTVATDLSGLTADDVIHLDLPGDMGTRLMQALNIPQPSAERAALTRAASRGTTLNSAAAVDTSQQPRNEVYEWLYAWGMQDAYYPLVQHGIQRLTDISALTAADLDVIQFPADWMRDRFKQALRLNDSAASSSAGGGGVIPDLGIKRGLSKLSRGLSGFFGLIPIDETTPTFASGAGTVMSAELGGPALPPPEASLPPKPAMLISESSDEIDMARLTASQRQGSFDDD